LAKQDRIENMECSVWNCSRRKAAHGLCLMHYKRNKRNGTPLKLRVDQRFYAHASEDEQGCWNWDKPNRRTGYGSFCENRTLWLAHRWSYTFMRAEIPIGLEIDHLCRNPSCVNPWHLEPVTRSENVRRAFDRLGCMNGHFYVAENLEIHRRGHRQCRQCRLSRERRYQRAA
jgi:hypothetical protein